MTLPTELLHPKLKVLLNGINKVTTPKYSNDFVYDLQVQPLCIQSSHSEWYHILLDGDMKLSSQAWSKAYMGRGQLSSSTQ